MKTYKQFYVDLFEEDKKKPPKPPPITDKSDPEHQRISQQIPMLLGKQADQDFFLIHKDGNIRNNTKENVVKVGVSAYYVLLTKTHDALINNLATNTAQTGVNFLRKKLNRFVGLSKDVMTKEIKKEIKHVEQYIKADDAYGEFRKNRDKENLNINNTKISFIDQARKRRGK